LLVLFSKPISGYLNINSPWLVIFLAVGITFYVPLGVRRGGMQGLYAFRRLAVNFLIEGAVKLVGAFVLIHLGFGVRGAMGAVSASLILAYFFSLMAIIVPAGTYTLTLVAPDQVNNNVLVSLVGSGWALFAALPLIWGIVPTARFTAVFLTTEMVVIAVFFALGFGHLVAHGAAVSPSLSWFVPTAGINFGALVTVAVVGFTIVDGWELDSHAAEEAKHRRTNPGTGGLIGLLVVITRRFYAVFIGAGLMVLSVAALAIPAFFAFRATGQELFPDVDSSEGPAPNCRRRTPTSSTRRRIVGAKPPNSRPRSDTSPRSAKLSAFCGSPRVGSGSRIHSEKCLVPDRPDNWPFVGSAVRTDVQARQ